MMLRNPDFYSVGMSMQFCSVYIIIYYQESMKLIKLLYLYYSILISLLLDKLITAVVFLILSTKKNFQRLKQGKHLWQTNQGTLFNLPQKWLLCGFTQICKYQECNTRMNVDIAVWGYRLRPLYFLVCFDQFPGNHNYNLKANEIPNYTPVILLSLMTILILLLLCYCTHYSCWVIK